MKKTLVTVAMMLASPIAFAGGDAAAGANKVKACTACHGADFNTPVILDAPRLAGQHADYLARALSDYKSGVRKDAVMSSQAQALSEKDIQDVAAYLHGLNGNLRVVPLHRFAN